MGRGHRQTDVIVMDFAKAFDKVPHKRLYTNLTSTGLEDLLISGSTRGSLSALKKWY